MRNPYFVLNISWYEGLFIVIGNSFYVEIHIRKKYDFLNNVIMHIIRFSI